MIGNRSLELLAGILAALVAVCSELSGLPIHHIAMMSASAARCEEFSAGNAKPGAHANGAATSGTRQPRSTTGLTTSSLNSWVDRYEFKSRLLRLTDRRSLATGNGSVQTPNRGVHEAISRPVTGLAG